METSRNQIDGKLANHEPVDFFDYRSFERSSADIRLIRHDYKQITGGFESAARIFNPRQDLKLRD
jgi:hypothetical protein